MFNSPRNSNFNPNDNASRFRTALFYAAWTIIGHPVAVVTIVLWVNLAGMLGVPGLPTLAVACLIPVVESALLRFGIGPHRLVMWANVVRFRRRWFTVWTATVKARSDHTTQGLGLIPVLGFLPLFKGSIGYFTVRPPSGQTLEFVAELADALAGQYPRVTQIEVIYERSTSSSGTLQAVFGNVNPTTSPSWTSTDSTATPKDTIDESV